MCGACRRLQDLICGQPLNLHGQTLGGCTGVFERRGTRVGRGGGSCSCVRCRVWIQSPPRDAWILGCNIKPCNATLTLTMGVLASITIVPSLSWPQPPDDTITTIGVVPPLRPPLKTLLTQPPVYLRYTPPRPRATPPS